jgi:hemerythrin superfamily protein
LRRADFASRVRAEARREMRPTRQLNVAGHQPELEFPRSYVWKGAIVAKKAKKAKKGTAKRKQASKSTARKAAARKSAKRAAKKSTKTKAAQRKVASRAAATRKRRPEREKTTLESAAAIARGVASTAASAVARLLPWAKDQNDPFELLMSDHRRFEQLLKEGEDSTERARKGRRELLQALEKELTVHETIEERILYPALEPHPEARKTTLEGYEEHHTADTILSELKGVATNDEKWPAKFKVLKENITHHISEEERLMFPAARGVLPREEQLALGARMRALRAELQR